MWNDLSLGHYFRKINYFCLTLKQAIIYSVRLINYSSNSEKNIVVIYIVFAKSPYFKGIENVALLQKEMKIL